VSATVSEWDMNLHSHKREANLKKKFIFTTHMWVCYQLTAKYAYCTHIFQSNAVHLSPTCVHLCARIMKKTQRETNCRWIYVIMHFSLIAHAMSVCVLFQPSPIETTRYFICCTIIYIKSIMQMFKCWLLYITLIFNAYEAILSAHKIARRFHKKFTHTRN
jgi:hypothetical protein